LTTVYEADSTPNLVLMAGLVSLTSSWWSADTSVYENPPIMFDKVSKLISKIYFNKILIAYKL